MTEDTIILPGIKILGSSAVAIALIRTLRWSIEFAFGRWDLRSKEMDRREAALEARLSKEVAEMRVELSRYRLVTTKLVAEMSRNDPGNHVLLDVQRILQQSLDGYAPMVQSDFDSGKDKDLLDRL